MPPPSTERGGGHAGRWKRRGSEWRRRLGARPSEVIFTAGGTESDNLAVKGLFWARRAAAPQRSRIVTSQIEHHAVHDAVQWLAEHEGAEVTWLPVDQVGRIQVEALAELCAAHGDEIAVITTMWANNEVGTIQPIDALAELAAAHGIPLHTDAIQAVGQLPVDFGAAGVAALSVTGHKLGGPTGWGRCCCAARWRASRCCTAGVRSGTCAPAPWTCPGWWRSRWRSSSRSNASRLAATLTELRDQLVARVRAAVPDAVYNGDPEHRLPGNAHFSFPGCEGDALLLLLDAAQVACSTGSACSAGVAQPSHVLLAMGADEAVARSSLRFTLGHTSTPADIDALIEALPAAVARARRAGLR